ncbi:MAG: PfkB family carbohydrate kinase [Bacteroidales bacterium]
MKNKIITLGEALIDIIIESNEPKTMVAGGSVVNASISLSRLGIPVKLISEIGNDSSGNFLLDKLNSENIDISSISPSMQLQTPIALAFLDEHCNAKYSIYKNYNTEFAIPNIEIHRNDIVLYGSYYSVSPRQHQKIIDFIGYAKSRGAFIIYDPNIRNKVHDDMNHQQLIDSVERNFLLADIIKGSDEDFASIYDAKSSDEAYNKLPAKKFFIYTQGSKEVETFYKDEKTSYAVPKISPKSTIGAGDNFNAGLCYSLFQYLETGISYAEAINTKKPEIIQTAIQFSSEVCLKNENSINQSIIQRLKL